MTIRALLGGIVMAVLSAPAMAGSVTFTIDATANVKPISRYIYGINAPLDSQFPNLTLQRLGGNRWTAWNWVNNASNAGSDYIFQNDDYLGGGNKPGGAVIPSANNAAKKSAGLIVTIPIQGYVAADKKGDGDVHNTPNYLQKRFREERAQKGAPFTLTPTTATKLVYQDEFVNWVKKTYPDSQKANSNAPIWFSLDNEPDLWAETHSEVHPQAPTYAELVQKGTDYAFAIKKVSPRTLVFGPVSYGWYGYVLLQGAPDANGRDFLDFYLKEMKKAEANKGRRLLDVLDLHWYSEALGSDDKTGITDRNDGRGPGLVAARVQAPRSLWDSTYKENSWIVKDGLDGKAIKLIPRMMAKIAKNYPGTKLAFTEYDYGGGGHISGGIAQADVLGIFGREGVFAACQWPLYDGETFTQAAFKMYRDFDGANGSFGDTSVSAITSDAANTSVYASTDSTDANRMVLIAINKTANPIDATINLSHAPVLAHAHVYQLTANSATPVDTGMLPPPGVPGSYDFTMPAYSVSTIVLTP